MNTNKTSQIVKSIAGTTMSAFMSTVMSTVLAVVVLAAPMLAKTVDKNSNKMTAGTRNAPAVVEIQNKIRRELVTLPFYGVFDNLAFSYEDGVVVLSGQVVRPTTKSSATRVVEKVSGVTQVINNIEVLPLSRFDDQIRIATYRAIYGQVGLDRLAIQAVPPIHIIVNNGNVTLEGVVLNRGDATRAYMAARGVANAFSVTSNLRIEKEM